MSAPESPPLSPATTAARSARRSARSATITGEPGGAEPAKRGVRSRLGKKPGPKKNKYLAKGKRIDGHFFHSSAEAARYLQLKDLVEAGVIAALELQPRFPLVVNNIHIAAYLADFRYAVIDDLGNTMRVVVEDVKGMMTDIYRLKRSLVHALYPVEIIEIPSRQVPAWEGRIP